MYLQYTYKCVKERVHGLGNRNNSAIMIHQHTLRHTGLFIKGWLAIATLKPTFTFLVGILPFNTFSWQNPYQKKVKVGFRVVMASQPFP